MNRLTLLSCMASVLLCASVSSAQQRFALQLFHFNVQYVCGGTTGLLVTPNELDLNNDEVEDMIIVESLAPVIDLFARHPTWGVDIELQAYALDVMAARHPALLDQMRTLAKSGQIDIVSFHYSDQLFIGYPQEDWERSNDLTAATFATHDIPLSRTVFCQEGQAAMGMAAAMAARGYRTMVWPKNLWIFQHGDFAAEPLYEFGNVLMVAGSKGVNADVGSTTIEVGWTFLDDGEILATGDFDPYFPEFFKHDTAAVAAYEARLSDLEAQGFRITTVDQYVDAIEALVTPATPPPLLDGTWQPDSTVGVKRWLGGAGAWRDQERDNHVRTLGNIAHRELVAAETIATQAGIDARAPLDAAWRMLFLGQVTDGSGINPFRGEIQYSASHVTEALRIAREQIDLGKEALGLQSALIDPAAGSATEGDSDGLIGQASDPPVDIAVEPGERSVSETWERIDDGHWRLTLAFGRADTGAIGVRFSGVLEDEFAIGLALDDATAVTLTRSDFMFESFHFALPTGWVGIGSDRYVLKDTAQVHVAAEVWRDTGELYFQDETAPPSEAQRWVFHVVEGTPEDAAAKAVAINTKRRLVR